MQIREVNWIQKVEAMKNSGAWLSSGNSKTHPRGNALCHVLPKHKEGTAIKFKNSKKILHTHASSKMQKSAQTLMLSPIFNGKVLEPK